MQVNFVPDSPWARNLFDALLIRAPMARRKFFGDLGNIRPIPVPRAVAVADPTVNKSMCCFQNCFSVTKLIVKTKQKFVLLM